MASKLTHLQGTLTEQPAGKSSVTAPVVVAKRQDHMQSSVFVSPCETLPARPVSARKISHLQGSLSMKDPVAHR